ncbi:MAG: hypothetical protein ACKOW9_04750 [Candidatus Paceibacterota bacterium]
MIKKRTERFKVGGKKVKRYKAFSLIEFLIASSLTLLVLGSASLATLNSQRAVKSANAYALGASVQLSVLEKMRARGCGETINFSSIDCTESIAAESKSSNSSIVELKISTTWLPRNASSLTTVCQPTATTKPELLERIVTTKIKNNENVSSTRVLTFPNGNVSNTGILVKGLQASSVISPKIELALSNNTNAKIVRYLSSSCQEQNINYSYLIPNVPAGSYTLTVTDRAGIRTSSITVSNTVAEVTL